MVTPNYSKIISNTYNYAPALEIAYIEFQTGYTGDYILIKDKIVAYIDHNTESIYMYEDISLSDYKITTYANMQGYKVIGGKI